MLRFADGANASTSSWQIARLKPFISAGSSVNSACSLHLQK
jgi:hypothetical protein